MISMNDNDDLEWFLLISISIFAGFMVGVVTGSFAWAFIAFVITSILFATMLIYLNAPYNTRSRVSQEERLQEERWELIDYLGSVTDVQTPDKNAEQVSRVVKIEPIVEEIIQAPVATVATVQAPQTFEPLPDDILKTRSKRFS